MMTDEKLKNFLVTIYGAYAVSAMMQFFESTLMLGLFLLTVAYILLVCRRGVAGSLYESHRRWLNRTLWIGSLIAAVAAIVSAWLVWTFTDISALTQSVKSGDPGAVMNAVNAYMDDNATRISLLTLITSVPTAAWWLRRCWAGYILLKAEQPVANVTTWL